MPSKLLRVLVVGLLALALSPPARLTAADKLEPARCGKIKQLHLVGDVYLAGQPGPDDLPAVKEKGIKAVLNLRPKSELDFDEEAAVKKAGLEYHHVPFTSADTLTDDVFGNVRRLLNDAAKRPVMVHCGSANRVGAVWLAHRVLDDGVAYEAALAEAKTVGLRTPALEQRAKDYIQKNRQKAKDR